MAEYGEWVRKGAVLSEVTAQKEYGVTRDFIVKGNDEGKLRALLANSRLRELIATQPEILLSVKDDEGYFGTSFPEGTDELHFLVTGVIKDVARLKSLYDLFAETLDHLCRIGSAYEGNPGVSL